MDALKTERLGQIHVSDIIKPCMRNVIYNKTEPKTGASTEDVKSLYFGQCVHSNSQLATEENHEKFLAYDYVRDVSLTREDLGDNLTNKEGNKKSVQAIFLDTHIQLIPRPIKFQCPLTGPIAEYI